MTPADLPALSSPIPPFFQKNSNDFIKEQLIQNKQNEQKLFGSDPSLKKSTQTVIEVSECFLKLKLYLFSKNNKVSFDTTNINQTTCCPRKINVLSSGIWWDHVSCIEG